MHSVFPSNEAIAICLFQNHSIDIDHTDINQIDLNGELETLDAIPWLRTTLASNQIFRSSLQTISNAVSQGRYLRSSSQIDEKVRNFLAHLRIQETGKVTVSFPFYPSIRLIGKSQPLIGTRLPRRLFDLFFPPRTKELHLICAESFSEEGNDLIFPPVTRARGDSRGVEMNHSWAIPYIRSIYSMIDHSLQFAQETRSISPSAYEKFELLGQTLFHSMQDHRPQLAVSAVKFEKIATVATYGAATFFTLATLSYLYQRLSKY